MLRLGPAVAAAFKLGAEVKQPGVAAPDGIHASCAEMLRTRLTALIALHSVAQSASPAAESAAGVRAQLQHHDAILRPITRAWDPSPKSG